MNTINLVVEKLEQENMEIIKLIQSINRSSQVPIDTINALIEKKEESFPVLVEIVRYISLFYKRIEDLTGLDYVVACYILSELREKRLFPHLIKLATIQSNDVERVWGGVVTKGLPRFLISTFDGNIQALKRLIENEAANLFCREAALCALVGLVAEKVLTREEVLDYFKVLMKSDLTYDYEFSASIIYEVCNLYPQQLYPEIVDLFERDVVDTRYVSKEYVEKVIFMGKEECLKNYLYSHYHLPIHNAIEEMSWLRFDEQSEVQARSKIGRNEPCYCGSNKKYKKCCISLFS